MTPLQITLVRHNFAALQPFASDAAGRFYARLFEIDPALRPLFSSNLQRQGDKLMAMLGTAVGLLEQPDMLNAALHRLGQRHVAYGVQPGHYGSVGQALLDTLAGTLGPAFDDAQRAAWAALYTQVAQTMINAAAAVPTASVAAESVAG